MNKQAEEKMLKLSDIKRTYTDKRVNEMEIRYQSYITGLRDMASSLSVELDEKDQRIVDLEQKLEESSIIIEELEENNEACKQRMIELNQEIAKLKDEKENLESEYDPRYKVSAEDYELLQAIKWGIEHEWKTAGAFMSLKDIVRYLKTLSNKEIENQ